MHSYEVERLHFLLATSIQQQVSPDAWNWLQAQQQLIRSGSHKHLLATAFASVSRKTGKQAINVAEEIQQEIQRIRPGLYIHHWTIDRLCRVWLLSTSDPNPKEQYLQCIEIIFPTAEMNELAALYAALPVLAWPQSWVARCIEGIRNNIGLVLEAIMCNNPYPAEYLDEPAWNQLVLKAFFTEKPIEQIIGLDQRANAQLAHILSDYAHERWSAGRSVHPMLWRCVCPFIDEAIFPDIERITQSGYLPEQRAAALVCAQSQYVPARQLLDSNIVLKTMTDGGTLNWNRLFQ
jgi:hypothetical protein